MGVEEEADVVYRLEGGGLRVRVTLISRRE